MSDAAPISVSTEGAARVIRLGADGSIFLTAPLCEALETALVEAEADPSVRTVVLTGANPGVFMRHYAVAEILAVSTRLTDAGLKPGDELAHVEGPIDRCIARIEAAPKPVIAAINGECMGGAMELALACDLRVAQAGTYRLGQPETLLGILPGAGGTQRLVRVVGEAHAMALALTGLPVDPDEARRIGLVHRVVPDALAAALETAAHLAKLPAAALAHVKRLVREARSLPLDAGLRLERALFLDLAMRPEGVALMRAYEAGRYRFEPGDAGTWRVDLPGPGDASDLQP